MAIELVLDSLSIAQYARLINAVNQSGKFTVDKRGHVSPSSILSNHPKGAGSVGYLPVGLITDNRAQLLNIGAKFPQDYHTLLREIYNSLKDQ